MIQDIFPHRFHIEYRQGEPSADSPMIIYKNNAVLIKNTDGCISFPTLRDTGAPPEKALYLFTEDDIPFFTLTGDASDIADKLAGRSFEYAGFQAFRALSPRHMAFAGVTGARLAHWYAANRFCGACGHKTEHSDRERALVCPGCGNIIYPRIDPAVIIGITDGDNILLTKYKGKGSSPRYALVAGYCETGETAEDTVRREVCEEVGLRVKNIRYYKSQPWLFSGSLLFGYFCEVDGDDAIRVDSSELDAAEWVRREDISFGNDGVSLTSEMIAAFKENRHGT